MYTALFQLACTTCNEEVQAGILGPGFTWTLAGTLVPFALSLGLVRLLSRSA